MKKNWYLIIAGVFAFIITVMHILPGGRHVLAPMLEAVFDPVAKRTLYGMWHFISAFLFFSSVSLLATGLNLWPGSGNALLTKFIMANYFAFAGIQIVVGFTADFPYGNLKLFQWMIFLTIAIFTFLGTRAAYQKQ